MKTKSRAETKAATREALIDAGLQAFAESGLDGPSLDAICARAGFTRGAFYVHFADREALLEAVIVRVMGAWLAAIATTPDADGLWRSIDSFIDAYVAEQDDPHGAGLVLRLFVSAANRDPTYRQRVSVVLMAGRGQLADVIRAGQAAGQVRVDVDADMLSGLLIEIVLGMLCAAELGVPVDAKGRRDLVVGLLRAA